MTKRILTFFLVFMVITSLACDIPTILPSGMKTGITAVSVSPYSGTGSFTLIVKYYHRLGDSVQIVSCTMNSLKFSLQPSTAQGYQELTHSFTYSDPGIYRFSCNSNETDGKMAEFEVIKPDEGTIPSETTVTGFKKHKPGEITSGGMWMLFDQGTSDLPGYPVPRQCLPGVNYTQAGGTSNLDVAADGTLTGSCALSYYGGDEKLTGTLTGKWDGDSGEIVFHLETQTEYFGTIKDRGDTTISGTMTNKTVYDGKGYMTSEYQATGEANWSTECSTTNPEAVVCLSIQVPTLKAKGTVPWQINFNA
jgi:hypothetical protein